MPKKIVEKQRFKIAMSESIPFTEAVNELALTKRMI
jgi:hypothetical protein